MRTVTMGMSQCVAGVLTHSLLSYPFETSDAGRSQSKRPKQSNDCTVRAVAIALELPYDEAYDLLALAGRKCTSRFDIVKWLKEQPWAEKLAFPAVKGERRMNPAKFCATYTTGRYICRVAKHVFAVVDGVVYDTTENRPDRCIYTAWQVVKAAELFHRFVHGERFFS